VHCAVWRVPERVYIYTHSREKCIYNLLYSSAVAAALFTECVFYKHRHKYDICINSLSKNCTVNVTFDSDGGGGSSGMIHSFVVCVLEMANSAVCFTCSRVCNVFRL